MSRTGKAFQLGSVIVPVVAALNYDERFENLEGATLLRLGEGAGVKQSVWQKWRVTLSGDGWMPFGLDTLDYTAPLVLRCAMPRAVTAAGASIALPSARRADAGYLPTARAHLANTGGWVDTALSIGGDTATVTPVSGAIAYSVLYYPQLTVIASRPTTSGSRAAGTFAWELACEEV